ncbi:MAG: fructose-bisphosphatase class III [Enterocloster sp.]
MMWYLWCGAKSPVFGKDKMTTFEHYFVEDKATHKESDESILPVECEGRILQQTAGGIRPSRGGFPYYQRPCAGED